MIVPKAPKQSAIVRFEWMLDYDFAFVVNVKENCYLNFQKG
jgi:hypothetical protein